MKYFILLLTFLNLFVSCEKDKNNSDNIIEILDVKEEPEILLDDYISINDNNFNLYTLDDNDIYEDNSFLNNIIISEILLPKDDGYYFTLPLLKTRSSNTYEYIYQNIIINILYYYKGNIDYSEPYAIPNVSYFKYFEDFHNGLITEIPNIVWHQNERLNVFNGFKYGDSFIFLAHEYSGMQLTRLLYLSTKNYYIRIRITTNDNARMLLFDNIYLEAPQYFKLYLDPYDGWIEIAVWENEDSMLRFGNDLINGENNSYTANNWYFKSEEILNKIQYR